MTTDTDEKLIIDIATGNRYSFALLVQRYQTPIINLIYRFLNDKHEAEDVAQEVFLKVWRNAGSFAGKSSFSTWLYRIAVNTCLNYKRSRKNTRIQQDETNCDPAEIPDQSSHPHSTLEAEERQTIINRAVSALPEKQRMALVLCRYEGHSYAETAALMNVSVSSVESLLFRAKQKLAKTLLPIKERGEL